MSLPLKAIDRLFDRLAATYGRQWLLMWDGVDGNAVKSSWAHELEPFTNSLHRIAWALENLPPKCPNVIEFKALCRQAPAPDTPRLPEPKADPERVKTELAKLGHMHPSLRAAPSGMAVDHKSWAKIIVARHEAGEKITPISLRFAREALGLHANSFA